MSISMHIQFLVVISFDIDIGIHIYTHNMQNEVVLSIHHQAQNKSSLQFYFQTSPCCSNKKNLPSQSPAKAGAITIMVAMTERIRAFMVFIFVLSLYLEEIGLIIIIIIAFNKVRIIEWKRNKLWSFFVCLFENISVQ